MLRLIQHSETPPDQYRKTFKEDGHTVKCFSYDGWLARIENHRRFNGYETPPNWIAEAEAELCAVLPPGWCAHEDGRPQEHFVDARVGIEDIIRGTRVHIEFVKQGAKVVDQEIAEARAATCAACYMRAPIPGCAPCVGLANYISEVSGARETKADAILEGSSCLVCKCSAKANVWMPIEASMVGVTDEHMATFPDFCWKRAEIEAIRNSNPLDG